MLNWKRFFFRFTTVLSFGGATLYLILPFVWGTPDIIPALIVFWGVWAVYGICHLLFEIGKWIYHGLFDTEK